MAYGGPSRQKDNFGRFQKQATINLTKKLQELTKNTRKNVREVIADELLETYKYHVLQEYSARGSDKYVHTDTLLDSIRVEIEEDRGIGRDRVRIVLDDTPYKEKTYTVDKKGNKTYHKRTVNQVYEFLTEGTERWRILSLF